MPRNPKITFSDLQDGRQVQSRMGLSSVELMRVVKDHTQKQGMGRAELQKFCEKVFDPSKK